MRVPGATLRVDGKESFFEAAGGKMMAVPEKHNSSRVNQLLSSPRYGHGPETAFWEPTDNAVSPVNPTLKGPEAYFARMGGIVWGGASDGKNLYYGLSRGAMVALQLSTGERLWYTPLAKPGRA